MRKFARILTLPIICVLLLTGQSCGGPSAAEIEATKPVTLTIWRVFDGPGTFGQIMADYRKLHPNISFNYREMGYNEYKDRIINALARGEGPDIISLHNTWLGEYQELLAPLPATLSIPYSETKGTIKKETITTIRQEQSITNREVKNEFVDVVADDVIRNYQVNSRAPVEQRIFALPMALDTMVLFCNRDLLNAAGIAEPPTTWTEFQEQVMLLTRVNADGEIIQSGAAIGTGANVERAADIISLLMMQNGTEMVDSRNRAAFANPSADRATVLGSQAVRFYTDFADPTKEVYTWDKDQPQSFEAFVNGQTAFFFGYSYHVPLVRSRNPKLNLEITSMPQIEGGRTVNFANYWVEAVMKSSPNQKWAWDFLQFATSQEHVVSYLDAAGKPTARRGLINQQAQTEKMYVFVNQILTSKSWYRGNNAEVMEQAFINLADSVLSGVEIQAALDQAQNKVNQTF